MELDYGMRLSIGSSGWSGFSFVNCVHVWTSTRESVLPLLGGLLEIVLLLGWIFPLFGIAFLEKLVRVPFYFRKF